MSARILLHVEDPGAANVIAPLAGPLRDAGHDVTFLADSGVAEFLTERGYRHDGSGDDPKPALEDISPDLVLVGTSENRQGSSLAMIEAARASAIPAVAAIDMLANADRRFRGMSDDPIHHAPDWLAVPDTPTADAYQALGFPGERITVCGHPHYDVVRARRQAMDDETIASLRARLAPGLKPGQPLVVFLAEAIDQLNPAASRIADSSEFAGSGETDDRTTVILEEVLEAVAGLELRPHFVLRLHPRNRADDYGALRDRVDAVSLGGDPLDLIACADLVIGMTTFLLVEAYLLGRPTLSVLPDIKEASWLPTTAGGATRVATTRKDLKKMLGELISPSQTAAAAVGGCLLPAGATARYVALIGGVLNPENNSNRAQLRAKP
jgi:hypothetical protein